MISDVDSPASFVGEAARVGTDGTSTRSMRQGRGATCERPTHASASAGTTEQRQMFQGVEQDGTNDVGDGDILGDDERGGRRRLRRSASAKRTRAPTMRTLTISDVDICKASWRRPGRG